jgi:hypothetical protein
VMLAFPFAAAQYSAYQDRRRVPRQQCGGGDQVSVPQHDFEHLTVTGYRGLFGLPEAWRTAREGASVGAYDSPAAHSRPARASGLDSTAAIIRSALART